MKTKFILTIPDHMPRYGIIYLAGPYSHPDEKERERRAYILSMAAGYLSDPDTHGLEIFSPITHGHHICQAYPDLPMGWEYWRFRCETFLAASNGLIVSRIDPAWEHSQGVKWEMEWAEENHLPVGFLDLVPGV